MKNKTNLEGPKPKYIARVRISGERFPKADAFPKTDESRKHNNKKLRNSF